jgi:hypothetical protein
MIGKLSRTLVLLIFLILFFAGLSAITSNYGNQTDMIGQQEIMDFGQELQHLNVLPKGANLTA